MGVELIINITALALSFREITHTKLGSSILPVREIATVIKLSPIMKQKKYWVCMNKANAWTESSLTNWNFRPDSFPWPITLKELDHCGPTNENDAKHKHFALTLVLGFVPPTHKNNFYFMRSMAHRLRRRSTVVDALLALSSPSLQRKNCLTSQKTVS